MKKVIFILSITITSTKVFAQFGVKAGIDLSKYNNAAKSFYIDRKAILAYHFGVLYKHKLSEKMAIQPELSNTVKGVNVYYSYPIGFTGPMKNTFKLNYL